jgi:hypothetical protein
MRPTNFERFDPCPCWLADDNPRTSGILRLEHYFCLRMALIPEKLAIDPVGSGL